MSLDGAYLSALKREISFLENGRIDKITQPSRDELLITMRAKGGNHRLLLSASPDSARVLITETQAENPKTPPMFCMLMRKHLGGGKLLSVRQDGLERVLFFDFEAMNELGDMTRLTLVAEIMGKHSNVILVGVDGRVIDSIRRVDMNVSEKRLILPGVRYAMPPRDDSRLDFRTINEDELITRINEESGETSRALIHIFEGLCPLLAREWVFKTVGVNNFPVRELNQTQKHNLFICIREFAENLQNGIYTPTVIIADDELKDFTLTDIHQYDDVMKTRSFEGEKAACLCLDFFYREKGNVSRLRQRAGDISKTLSNLTERISGRMAAQKTELEKTADRFMIKTMGDLLSANLYRIKVGEESFSCENFYDENLPVIEIPLDKKLSPAKNAQKYYNEYKKAETREKILTEQIKKGESELVYIESVADSLSRAKTDAEIEELRQELVSEGYIKQISNPKQKIKKTLPLSFFAPDGTEILVGRNNIQNDIITKNAEKTDIWLHTKNIPGSHLIIKTGGKEPSDETIRYAARLAAAHSKAFRSAQVPVDVVAVRYVKKPAKSKPGMVIFTNNQTIYVTPLDLNEKFGQIA
jgi:predicted ribosome quality control (RQC) complex YloA/Tae2 family protein